MTMSQDAPDALAAQEQIRHHVREGYARIATGEAESCCGPTRCCGGNSGDDSEKLALAVGYSGEDLADLPEGSNLGLSCGNPVALAALRPGEVVVDLGSGGGFDVFIAGRRVGPEGRAIGVDMTPEMIARARANIAAYRRADGPDNVEFRLGEIEHLPLADASVDAIISNCVINLSADKPQVWREIARVLKPGGRVAVSDIALRRDLPPELRETAESLVGCVAGAVLVSETEAMARAAGLTRIELEEKTKVIDAMTPHKESLYRGLLDALPEGEKLSDYVVSLSVNAKKPGGSCCCGGQC